MDAFEQVVKVILEGQGWWVRQGYKIELTKEEKACIGRHSSPRWEIDLLAYKPELDQVLAVECKSFLDSPGVAAKDFSDSDSVEKSRYKLFNEPKLREVVLGNLRTQLLAKGLALKSSEIKLAMAVGKCKSKEDREKLHKLFEGQKWELYDDLQIREWTKELSNRGYDDSIATIVAKIIARKPAPSTAAK